MNYFLLASSIAVAIAALIDGISTVRFLRSPDYEETNPLFGKRPSAARVYGEGAAIIAIELAVAFSMNHVSENFGYLLGGGLLYQAYTHIRDARRNFKLPVSR
jgi:hypothetical protein